MSIISIIIGVDMIREILTDKWVLGSFTFFLVFSCVCYLWHVNTITQYRQDALESASNIQKLKRNPISVVNGSLKQSDSISTISKTQSKTERIPQYTSEVVDNIKKKNGNIRDDSVESHNKTRNTEIPVSKFGLGPFPERPSDYDKKSTSGGFLNIEHELMGRVRVKLWTQGIRDIKGMCYAGNGRIYLNRPDTVYIDFKEVEESDGISRSIDIYGNPISDEDFAEIRQGKTPQGLIVLDITDGIEPYSFLGLNKP